MNAFDVSVGVVGGLALFLFGMKVMSEGLQMVAGSRMRKILSSMTSNRFLGVITGVVVTCAIQSSSATTVMLVGFVHAGLITLVQSIGVIMGANIGTTFTGWLVAVIGFKVHITAMALPSIAIGFFVRFLGSRQLKDWGEVLLGFGLLFLGLDFLKEAVGHFRESEVILSWMAQCRADEIGPRIVAVLAGMVITFIIQSSSAALAVTMTLAAQGIIDVPTACALAIGQNIGTTITANIAAIGTSASARRAARAHMLFNVMGAIWPIVVFVPFLKVVDTLVPGSTTPTEMVLSQAAIAVRLAMFHTLFNIINTIIFLPFTKQLAWMATFMVRGTKEADDLKLKFLDPKLVNATPMALHAARNELMRMLDEVENMLNQVITVILSPKKKLGKVTDAVLDSEQTLDMLEKEITQYLVEVSQYEISFRQSQEIAGIINAVSDLERIGDHCENLLKLSQRLYDNKLDLGEDALGELSDIANQSTKFVALLKRNMFRQHPNLMKKANQVEETIDEMRGIMRTGHVVRLNEGTCEVLSGLIFIDMLNSFEKIGDHAYNVAQMLAGER